MTVRIRGREVPVNIERELDNYPWGRASWTGEKLIACSPFRDERRPSFACSLDTGVWVDSGSLTEEWGKGNFIKLMAYLRNETYEEAEEYLLHEYSTDLIDVETVTLDIELNKGKSAVKTLSMELLNPFAYKHPYLNKRGLTDKTQRAVKIGYDPKTRSIVIPWFDFKGRLVNWKHRSVIDKVFWYYKDGQKIRNHLYGLHLIYRLDRRDEVFVVESEIDALTLWQNGYSAVALGGARLTNKQKDLLIRAGIRRIVIATDNDSAGAKVKESIKKRLGGLIPLSELIYPPNRKDVNDFTESELKNIKTKQINFGFLKE